MRFKLERFNGKVTGNAADGVNDFEAIVHMDSKAMRLIQRLCRDALTGGRCTDIGDIRGSVNIYDATKLIYEAADAAIEE